MTGLVTDMDVYGAALPRFVRVWVVELHGAGTVSHGDGRVDFTLCSQCQALGHALVLCRQGRGDSAGCVGLLSARPPHLWVVGQVRNDGFCVTLLRGWFQSLY